MTTKTKPTSELDEFLDPPTKDEVIQEAAEASHVIDDLDAQLAKFSAELEAVITELLPNATPQKRKAVKNGAWGDEPYARLFEKNDVTYYIGKLNSFIANVEKKAAETAKPAATPKPVKTEMSTADAPLAKSASEAHDQPQPAEPTATDNTPLPEAKFVAWFDAFDGMGLKVSFTVRATRVSEGLKELDILKKYVFANGYSAQRAQVDPPSTANRRIGANEPASAPKQNGASAPVRSFDPDADNKPKAEIFSQAIVQIQKVMAQDGKVQINLYPPLDNGGEAQYPFFYLKSDADKEEVWKHIDVDAMELAKRYTFKATVDYVLSTKLNSKGNPYKNLRAIHPE